MTFRAPLFVSLCLLFGLSSFAADGPMAVRERLVLRATRHYILEPQHVLSASERSDLAAKGCVIQRALTGGRLLVSIDGDSIEVASDLRVRSIAPLTANGKLERSAYRVIADAKPFARFRVLFHEDVTFAAARSAVIGAGAALEDPLAFDFGPLRNLNVRSASSANVYALAEDERVFLIYGAPRRRARTLNASSALMSHVNAVQASPYSLTGNGVVLTYFELALADAAHAEFGGRLQIRVTCGSSLADPSCYDQNHPTHTAGTMIASGISSEAKGIAPAASLVEFRAADENNVWLTDKQTTIQTLGSVADSNSWGYITNWCPATTCTPPNKGTPNTSWVWTDDLAGAYDSEYNPALDKIALTNGSLMVFSAGNEAQTVGPSFPWYIHNHVDQNGDATVEIYCYSANGSGRDCPAPCTSGTQYCETETVRHPSHNPYGSIGWLASSKNVISVAALSTPDFRANFSSCGPTQDGRIKPEISALGVGVYSTIAGSACSANPPPPQCYANMSGTSMAAPVIAGGSALLVEQWRKTFGGASPSPDVLKALEIFGADDIGNAGPSYETGYGLFNAKTSADTIIADGGKGTRIKIDSAANGQRFDHPVTVSSTGTLRVVLSWFDPEIVPLATDPANIKTLLNDLDLSVTDTAGNTVLPYVLNPAVPTAPATRGADHVNNTEEVEIKGATPGVYHVIVTGTTVTANPPQQFVLIANADFTAAPPPCTDPTEPNSTAATAYGPLATNSVTQARICDATDVDFFRFMPNASGVATIVVSASDTPLTVSVGSGTDALSPLVTQNVASGASQTFTINASAGTQYLVSVKPDGTLGASGAYTVSATYPFTWPARRRATRR